MRTYCHNRLDIDYTARQAREDLEDAIRDAWNTRNGRPQCTLEPLHTLKRRKQ